MPFDLSTAVPVQQNQDNPSSSKGGDFDIASAKPVDASGKDSATEYDKFRQHDGSGALNENTSLEVAKTGVESQSKGTPQAKQHQTVQGPKDYPDDGMLNAVVHTAEGAVWNDLAKPIMGPDWYNKVGGADVDKYLSDTEKHHPIASVIGGTAPFVASSFLFPESLLPNMYSRLAVQFGAVGGANAVGEAYVNNSDKPFAENLQNVANETIKSMSFAPIYAKAQAFEFVDRPFASALARAGIITAGNGVMSTFFGDNITQAFKQSGILGALSLITESPHLAKTVIGRGILNKVNSIRSDMMVKSGLPDQSKNNDTIARDDQGNPITLNADLLDLDKLKKQIDGAATDLAGTIKGKGDLNLKPVTIEDFNQQQKPLAVSDIKVDPLLVQKINDLQQVLGKQISISNGFRTPEYNELLKSQGYNVADKSLHMDGRAADIPLVDKRPGKARPDLTHQEIVDAAHKVGLNVEDIKLTPKHVHVELPTDNSPTPSFESKTVDPLPPPDVKIVNPEVLDNISGPYHYNDPFQVKFGKDDKATSKNLRSEFAGIKNLEVVKAQQLRDQVKEITDEESGALKDKLLKQVDQVNKQAEKAKKSKNKDLYKQLRDESKALKDKADGAGKLVRQGMFWYKAAQGNTDFLLEMLSEPAMAEHKIEIENAFNFSPKTLEALDLINKYYEDSGNKALELGTVRSVVENYMNRIYVPEDQQDYVKTEIGATAAKMTTRHAKQRVYDNEFDAIMGGKKFAITDIADALAIHGEEMARVNTARRLADAMVDNKLGAWKRPDNIPDGWEQVGTITKNVPLKNEKGDPVIGEDGNQMISRSVFVAPKGISKGLQALVEPNFVSRIDWLRNTQRYQGLVKTIDLSLSFFHHLNMAAQVMYQGGIRAMMNAPRMEQLLNSGSFREIEQDFARHTGMTSKIDTNKDILRDLVKHDKSLYGKVSRLPVVKQYLHMTEESAEVLFGHIQRYLKVMDYGEKISTWAAKNLSASDEDVKAAKIGFAKQVNVTYGGLNWEAMGISRSQLSLLRLGLLAPDWTISNVGLLKYALGDKGVAGQASRKHILTALVGGMVLTEGINKLLTGNFTDKNKKGHALEVEISPNVYVSLLRGGIGDISKFGSMVMESGLAGVTRFSQGKLSPFARTFIGLLNNVQYTGRAIAKKTDGPALGTYHILAYLLGSAGPEPLGVSNFMSYVQDPNTKKTPTGALAVLSGLGRYSVPSKMEDKEMTPYRIKELAAEQKLSPIERQTKHMSFEKVAQMYENAPENTDEEKENKEKLKQIMDRKASHKKSIYNWTENDQKLLDEAISQ